MHRNRIDRNQGLDDEFLKKRGKNQTGIGQLPWSLFIETGTGVSWNRRERQVRGSASDMLTLRCL